MAVVSAEELLVQVQTLYTGADYFYALLVNDGGVTFDVNSTLEDIIRKEQDPTIGGYQRKEVIYTSGDINTYNSGISIDAKTVTYTHSNVPTTTDWSVTHVAVVRAPSSKSATNVLPVLSTFDMSGSGTDIANDTINVSAITNFSDGDPVVITCGATNSLPAGLQSASDATTSDKLYIKKTTGNLMELYSDSGLTTKVDITGVSSGTGDIRNAVGNLLGFYELSATLPVAGTQTITFDIDVNQGQ